MPERKEDTIMQTVLAFDVNETLLDLRSLDPLFQGVFGDGALRPVWFSQMLQLAFTGTITGGYVDFTAAQYAALQMLAARRAVTLDPADADTIVGAMSRLPPYPEVKAALTGLAGAGYRLAALTNSVKAVAEAQLVNAGLRACFSQVLSADQVQRLKPAPEPYHLVATQFGVAIGDVRLIAAHAWDIAGALAAGCRAAFISRPGMVLSPIGVQPDIIARDIQDVAEQIQGRDR
jgi:2-haloacid dehalogenase